jgi:hypothetical protein
MLLHHIDALNQFSPERQHRLSARRYPTGRPARPAHTRTTP